MTQSSPLRIGTRGSRLALFQANLVSGLLAQHGTPSEIVTIKTSGDRILDRSLADAGGKGLFTKELEEALFAESVDLAVHSMKDVPAILPEGLAIGAVLPRENPADVMIAASAARLSALPAGARVGTSSVRRTAQLRRARPDLDCVLLRGNVDTRLAKLDRGEMDAILLAYAGLNRLGLAHRITDVLDTEEWLPSLSQGAIGIEARRSDARTMSAVALLDDHATAVALACERAFQAALDGTCRTPVAGLAKFDGGRLCFRGEVIAPDGRGHVETSVDVVLSGDGSDDAARAGDEAGRALKPRAIQWLA